MLNDSIRRYPHPFTETPSGHYHTHDQEDPVGLDTPRTLVELWMCTVSATIREKKDWHVKFRDPEIRAKWREEIVEYGLIENLRFTDNMVRTVSNILRPLTLALSGELHSDRA